jgi:hypothetical protein
MARVAWTPVIIAVSSRSASALLLRMVIDRSMRRPVSGRPRRRPAAPRNLRFVDAVIHACRDHLLGSWATPWAETQQRPRLGAADLHILERTTGFEPATLTLATCPDRSTPYRPVV